MTEVELDRDSVLEVLVEDSRPDIEQSLRIRSKTGQITVVGTDFEPSQSCLLYTSPSPRDLSTSRMPSSA